MRASVLRAESRELSKQKQSVDLFLATPVDSAPEGPGVFLLVLHAHDTREILN